MRAELRPAFFALALACSPHSLGSFTADADAIAIADAGANPDALTPAPALLRHIVGSAATRTIDPSIPVRVVRAPCAVAGRVAAPEVDLWNDHLGDAGWDCADGLFFMGPSYDARVAVTAGTYAFHFRPPDGYVCDGYALYGGNGDEAYAAWAGDCVLTFTVDEHTADELFLWFFVRAQNWLPCAEDANCVSAVCGCNGAPPPAVCLPSELYPRECASR